LTTPAQSSRPRRRRRGSRSSSGSRPHTSHPPRHAGASTAAGRESAIFDPAPLAFQALVSDPALLEALEQRGYEQTTPVQSAVLPYALAGRDVIGCAATGTGKTAAYLLPILSRMLRAREDGLPAGSQGYTRALILAPTRELATQIDDEIQGFAYHSGISSMPVYGGVPMEPQERALKAGVDIVVATPGRLLDHMRSRVGDFSRLDVFVLDEADRMMDMGFWPDVRKIAEALPPVAFTPDDALLGDDAGRGDALRRHAGAQCRVRAGRIAPRAGAHDHARGPHPAFT
jgi:ATP-dependent RNA helicase RhlE